MSDWMLQAVSKVELYGPRKKQFEQIGDALRQAYERGLEDAAKVADEWSDTGTMLLRAGEMTAQEKRTAKAIVTSVATAIRQMKETRE